MMQKSGSDLRVKDVNDSQVKLFYASRTDAALRFCIRSKCRPLTMPEVIDERIRAHRDSPLWQENWIMTTSIKATGKTSQGTPVVLYVHTKNAFSNPTNITVAIEVGLDNGAGALSTREFRRLLKLGENGETDKAGNRLVWVVDYQKLKPSNWRSIPVGEALAHPLTIPFIGSEERAKAYFARFNEVFRGRIEDIGLCLGCSDDDLRDQPMGRFLFVSGNHLGDSLPSDTNLDYYGQFIGMPVRRVHDQRPISEID